MRIARDDFTGSGAWSTALWPYAQYQDSEPTRQPTRVQDSGLGIITNYSQVYKYGRWNFVGSQADYGLLVRGRFATTGSPNIRIGIRCSRDGHSNGDYTFPATGYMAEITGDNSTVSVARGVNSSYAGFTSFTVSGVPGTQWWNLRMEIEGSQFRIRFWYGTNEPTTWNRTITDSNPLPAGESAFGVGYVANQVTQLEFVETYDFFTILQLSGSITPTATHPKRALKRLGGSITGAATLSARRVVTRLFTGSLTPGPGIVRRAVVRTVGGSIAPVASYSVGLISKRLGGTLTPSGPSLRRTPRRLLGGAITASGVVLTRSVGRIAGRPGIVAVTVRAAGQIRARVRRG